MEIINLLKKGAQVIDVRTPAEFIGGHVVGSVNIPLGELENRLIEVRNIDKPLILCCLSGGRSAQACRFLQENNIDCTNGGSWFDMNKAVQEII